MVGQQLSTPRAAEDRLGDRLGQSLADSWRIRLVTDLLLQNKKYSHQNSTCTCSYGLFVLIFFFVNFNYLVLVILWNQIVLSPLPSSIKPHNMPAPIAEKHNNNNKMKNTWDSKVMIYRCQNIFLWIIVYISF